MKYLKKFESNCDYGEYWSLAYDPHIIRKSLRKISCSDRIIDSIISFLGDDYHNTILYVVMEVKNNNVYWDASFDDNNYKSYKYNGEIKLSKNELEEVEIEKNSKKFNI